MKKTRKISDNKKNDKKKISTSPKSETNTKTKVKPKDSSKPKADSKPKTSAKPKADAKPKTSAKPKADAKPKTSAKPKADAKPKALSNPKSAVKHKLPAKKTELKKNIKLDDNSDAEKIGKDATSETVKISGLSGFFDIKKSKDGRYVFNLYASNRIIIATSQIYSSSQSALNGANSVMLNAKRAGIEDQTIKDFQEVPSPKWEIYRDKAKQFRFRLLAPNGSCICHSQGYTSKASCKNGIESIIRTVESAKIDKNYLIKK